MLYIYMRININYNYKQLQWKQGKATKVKQT